MKKIILGSFIAGFMAVSFVAPAFAATTYSLFGDATIVTGGNPGNAAQLRSVDGGGFGGVSFAGHGVTTLSDLTNLATDYKFTENSCGGGSPRFQVRLTDGTNTGNIFVYLGLPPSYTLCPPNVWTLSGNLVSPVSLVDTAQLPGGAPYDPYASALVKYGTYTVTGISVVADGEWAFPVGNQTVLVDNIQINTDVVTFEPNTPATKDECKNGGWQSLEDADGNPFKNQGDCVSYANHH